LISLGFGNRTSVNKNVKPSLAIAWGHKQAAQIGTRENLRGNVSFDGRRSLSFGKQCGGFLQNRPHQLNKFRLKNCSRQGRFLPKANPCCDCSKYRRFERAISRELQIWSFAILGGETQWQTLDSRGHRLAIGLQPSFGADTDYVKRVCELVRDFHPPILTGLKLATKAL
jgi:hypothetical protein